MTLNEHQKRVALVGCVAAAIISALDAGMPITPEQQAKMPLIAAWGEKTVTDIPEEADTMDILFYLIDDLIAADRAAEEQTK